MIVIVALLIITILIAIGISTPISLGAAALVSFALLDTGFDTSVVPKQIFDILNSWVIMSVVLFVLYGRLCVEMNIRARLANTVSALFGRSRSSAIVGEILASLAQPDASGEGLLQKNDEAAATTNRLQLAGVQPWAAVGFSGVLACLRLLAPPSVLLIIAAAILLEISIANLFAALTPLVLGAALLLWLMAVVIPGDRRVALATNEAVEFEFSMLFWLGAPWFILGGILFGAVTPREAGAVGVGFAVIVGLLQRQLTGRRLLRASMDALQDSGAIILAFVFATMLITVFKIDGSQSDFIEQAIAGSSPSTGLFTAVLVFLLVTALLGPLVTLFVLLPIVSETLVAVGFAPVVIVVVSCAAIALGLLLPPTGPIFATLIAGTTGSTSRAIAGLSYFSLVVVLLLLVSTSGPLWTLT